MRSNILLPRYVSAGKRARTRSTWGQQEGWTVARKLIKGVYVNQKWTWETVWGVVPKAELRGLCV